MRVSSTTLLGTALLVAASAAGVAAQDGEWADGIPYTTDWDQAIKQVRNSGKLLFIYNGWQRKGI